MAEIYTMSDDEAHSIYEQTKKQKIFAQGSFSDCYKVDHDKLKHSLAVLVMTTGYKPENVPSIMALHNRIMAANLAVLAHDVNTPQIHYSGVIDGMPLTIKEFVEGEPLYHRNSPMPEPRAMASFCRQNNLPIPQKAEDVLWISGMIDSYNAKSAWEIADSDQDMINKFYMNVLTTKKFKTHIDYNPDNYIKTPNGLCIIDPVGCDYDGIEEPVTSKMLDKVHGEASSILVPPIFGSKDEYLTEDIKEIKNKCARASEMLRRNV
ncbi:MAG: hypothetical protein FWE38_04910 [Firmicutes bacterium]|nr:hypothetical protein [Bacillota bacterium]